jgi:hypothetical protein
MRAAFGLLAAASALGVASFASCTAELGDLPARCPDGECPEGYDCINGVCAPPGTAVPVTIVRVGNLRGGDMRVLPQSTSALVVWENYAYSEEGQSIVAVRIFADGTVSEQLVLDDSWVADAGLLEPYFDVLPINDESVLLALASSPLGDDPRPRLRVFTASLPPEGGEASGASSEPAWPEELLMPTIGYGAVSQPRFVGVGTDRVDLGYFQSLSSTPGEGGGGEGGGGGGGGNGAGGGSPDEGATLGQLAVFELDETGSFASPPGVCDADDDTCCRAHVCSPARASLPVAVGVAAGFPHADGVTWILDETRPSALVLGTGPAKEIALPPLAVPLTADAEGVLLLEPSQRTGEQLPTDPVEGQAEFGRHTGAGETVLSRLPGVRDTPRPAWVRRSNGSAVLVTPGTDAAAPELLVYTVDETLGDATEVARVPRFSGLQLLAVQAVTVDGKLFVVWLEQAEEEAIIRAAVLPEP